MSGTLAIVLIILVWLFVLAPWLLRGQKPIRKAGEAFDETRVVYTGGSEELPMKRRPNLKAGDVHLSASELEAHEDAEAANAPGDTEVSEDEVLVEDTVVLPKVADEELERTDAETSPRVWVDEDGTYEFNDAYTAAADFLHPAAKDPQDLSESAAQTDDDAADFAELTEEDIEFAESRRGRGGYDPIADDAHSADRFQRRRRTLGGFAVLIVLTVIAAVILGGWAWAGVGTAVLLGAVYLLALRSQVRAEEELRKRRVRQLRRARLGVRSANDDLLGIPQRLRHPGAVVLEIDDESPDFVDLDELTMDSVLPPVGPASSTEERPHGAAAGTDTDVSHLRVS